MKYKLLLFLLLSVHSFAFSNSAIDLRNQFVEACRDEKKADQFFKTLQTHQSTDIIIQGYSGAAETILAKFRNNPINKYRCCKNGLERLNLAITKSPRLLELRYLRFILEYNLPSFLNLSGHMEDDKSTILHLLRDSNDEDLNKRVTAFFLEKNICKKEELSGY